MNKFEIDDKKLTRYNGTDSSVDIPGGVTIIGRDAFTDCTSLEAVSIPADVICIGKTAFTGCTSLREIRFGGTKAQWEAIEKIRCWKKGVPARRVICSNGRAKLA